MLKSAMQQCSVVVVHNLSHYVHVHTICSGSIKRQKSYNSYRWTSPITITLLKWNITPIRTESHSSHSISIHTNHVSLNVLVISGIVDLIVVVFSVVSHGEDLIMGNKRNRHFTGKLIADSSLSRTDIVSIYQRMISGVPSSLRLSITP